MTPNVPKFRFPRNRTIMTTFSRNFSITPTYTPVYSPFPARTCLYKSRPTPLWPYFRCLNFIGVSFRPSEAEKVFLRGPTLTFSRLHRILRAIYANSRKFTQNLLSNTAFTRGLHRAQARPCQELRRHVENEGI